MMNHKESSGVSYSGRDPSSEILVSIIIPFFNEEKGIDALANRLNKVLSDLAYQFEIVVVDDGSEDGTIGRLQAWQEQNDSVVIVKLSRNWGHQNAFNAGLDVAQGRAIIFMDGDLEDPPELIMKLLSGWAEGYDTVYTVKSARHQTGLRRLLTNLYYRLINATNLHSVEPQAGMYSLVDEKVASVLRKFKETSRSYPNLRRFVGFKQKRVVYSRAPRAYGEPKQTLGRLISDGLNALFSNSYLPIRIITLIGVSFSLIFIFLGVIVLFVRFTGIEFWIFQNIPGTQMILLAILAFGSMQITFMGVIGEYIARIYEESKGRPCYVIEEIQRADVVDRNW